MSDSLGLKSFAYSSLLLFLLLSSSCTALSTGALSASPPEWQELLEDSETTFVVQQRGQSVGYTTASFRFEGGVWVSENELILRSRQRERRIYERLEFDAKWPHRLSKVEYQRSVPAFRGHLRPGEVERRVVTRSGDLFHLEGSRQRFRLDYTLRDAFAVEEWLASTPAVGETMRQRDLNSEDLRTSEVEVVMLARSPQATRYSRRDGDVVSTVELDATGQPRVIESGLGLRFVRADSVRQVAAEEAQRLVIRSDPEARVESEPMALVLWQPIAATGELASRLGGVELDELRIHLQVHDQRRATWHQRRGERARVTEVPSPTVEQRLGSALPPIVLEARRLRSLEGREQLQAGVDWVRSQLTPAWSPGRASVANILQQSRGDCTEYSRLFAAVMWALGYPSREVVGWVLAEGGSFVPHMWCEVALHGEWWSVDAALNVIDVPVTHLPMRALSAATEVSAEALLTGSAAMRLHVESLRKTSPELGP